MELALPILVDALSSAATVFLVAAGLGLVFNVLHVLNVAHGSFYAFGAYAAVLLTNLAIGQGLSGWWSLLLMPLAALLVALALGPLVERLFIRFTLGKSEAVQILVTFALFLMFEDVQKFLFGVMPLHAGEIMGLMGVTLFGGMAYLNYQLLLIVMALLIYIGLRLFLARTRQGQMIRAVVIDKEMSEAIGINTRMVFMTAFTLGVFLSALGGALASPISGVGPGVGAEAIVMGFAVAAIGGLGQLSGAVLGSIIVGLASTLATYFLPVYQPVTPYLAMLAVLIVRPYGLLSVTQARKI